MDFEVEEHDRDLNEEFSQRNEHRFQNMNLLKIGKIEERREYISASDIIADVNWEEYGMTPRQ